MQNRNSEELFALVKGMSKSEKKNFTLYAGRNSHSGDLKVLALFQALNAMDKYDEKSLVRRMGGADCRGLGSLKALLYQQLLESLRLVSREEQVDVQLRQLIDHANVLIGKGLPMQAAKLLSRAKVLAKRFHQVTFCYQVVMTQKRLELVHGRCDAETVAKLTDELGSYSAELSLISDLSNRSMLLYGYLKHFGACAKGEVIDHTEKVYQEIPSSVSRSESFYVRLHLVQLQTYYYLLRGELSSYLSAATAWLSLFQRHPYMQRMEAVQFYRALAHVNEAAYFNCDCESVAQTSDLLAGCPEPFYFYLASLNRLLVQNNFDVSLVKEVLAFAASDPEHERLLVVCEKAARLCLEHKEDALAIEFTNRALNEKTSIRPDLQFVLRSLHIAAHERLGNVEIIDYLKRSAHRFMNALSASSCIPGAKRQTNGRYA